MKVEERVIKALNSIRPYLQSDGGDVELLEIGTDKIVRLRLLGACRTCSMSHMTMKAGVEKAILKAAPELVGVEAELSIGNEGI